MKHKRSILLLLVLLCPRWGWALQVHTIDEYHPLKTAFSTRSFNRVIVDKGGIKKVVVPEGHFAVEIDELTRQAFMTCVKPLEQPATISVITDRGYVQDLVIEGVSTPTETLLLKEPTKEEEIIHHNPNDLVKHVLSALENQMVPYGYTSSMIQAKDERQSINASLKLKPIKAIEGPFDRIVTYHLINTSKVKVPISESMIQESEDFWIHLDQSFIEPNETSMITIAKKRVNE